MQTPKIKALLRDLARSNWHIHTCRSNCAASDMTVANIVRSAEKAGLETLALTDHHYPESNLLKDVAELKREAAGCGTKIKILIGAELSAIGPGVYADTAEINRGISYRLYATNHYHLDIWRHPLDRTPAGYAKHQCAILKELIESGRADCIAHPYQGVYLKGILKDPLAVTKALSDEALAAAFVCGREKVAWEISVRFLVEDIDFARRYISIGLEAGARFRLGTDAHRLKNIDPHAAVEHLIRLV